MPNEVEPMIAYKEEDMRELFIIYRNLYGKVKVYLKYS